MANASFLPGVLEDVLLRVFLFSLVLEDTAGTWDNLDLMREGPGAGTCHSHVASLACRLPTGSPT